MPHHATTVQTVASITATSQLEVVRSVKAIKQFLKISHTVLRQHVVRDNTLQKTGHVKIVMNIKVQSSLIKRSVYKDRVGIGNSFGETGNVQTARREALLLRIREAAFNLVVKR